MSEWISSEITLCERAVGSLGGMASRHPAEPTDLSDAAVHGYFAYVHDLVEENARLLRLRKPIPKRVPAFVNPLSQWLTDMLLIDPPDDGPERAWPVILELIARAPDDEGLAFIGSSAIEDLVNQAGARFADRIEAQSDADTRFAQALAFVWPNADVPDRVRALIVRARDTARRVTFPDTY